MTLGRVVGTVVATRKDERVEGFKLLVVRAVGPDGTEKSSYLVAVDTVAAGGREVVQPPPKASPSSPWTGWEWAWLRTSSLSKAERRPSCSCPPRSRPTSASSARWTLETGHEPRQGDGAGGFHRPALQGGG